MSSNSALTTFVVTQEEQGLSLHSFLKGRCGKEHSAKSLKRAIDAKQCHINGKVELFSSYVLAKGDVVEIDLSEMSKPKEKPTILYEDTDLLICNKTVSLVSEGDKIKEALGYAKGYLELVHRLDKDTTGVLILAKNEPMHEAMKALFSHKKIRKWYLALVKGCPKKSHGSIDNFLGKKGSFHGQTLYGEVRGDKEGQRAITFWRCLEKGKDGSLMLCEPITGRTHQIRVHMKELGHPILGDAQYGTEVCSKVRASRQMLHAYAISFPHPKTQKELFITAPLPSDFIKILRQLKVTLHGASDLASWLKEAR